MLFSQSFAWCLVQAILLISSASAAKDKAVKEAAFKVLACCALRYKQLEQVLTALTDMLNKDEHMSTVCAELAEYAAKQLGDNQLVWFWLSYALYRRVMRQPMWYPHAVHAARPTEM